MEQPRLSFTLKQMMFAIADLAAVFGVIVLATRGFWRLGIQALSQDILYPWFSILAFAAFYFALVGALADSRVWQLRSAWAFLPFLIPFIILSYGFDRSPPEDVQRRLFEIQVLFWCQIPLGIVLLIVLRRIWMVVLGLSIVAAWASLGCLVTSSMAITGT